MSDEQALRSSPSRSPDTGAEGLECQVGRARLVLPVDRVQQIVECDVVALGAIARDLIGGLGLGPTGPAISISLVKAPAERVPGSKRTVTAALLTVTDEVAWMLEVDRVVGLVRVRLDSARTPAVPARSAQWLIKAMTLDDRSLAWIDVDGMIEELRGRAAKVAR